MLRFSTAVHGVCQNQGTVTMKLTEKDGTVRFQVHAKPRARKSAIVGAREDGSLEVALAAPPVDGAANSELVRVLAAALGVGRRSVEIVRGETAQKKLVEVAGLSVEEVLGRLIP
jgi:uncharacterized protein (TIGR00251 family)